ncbi:MULTISPECIES: FKBP-type peptidyl-prolyl cis-trans isomerase [Acidobacteriaceae]|uniref:FKBP-type peptidyl-prolyl cis-trans isomerase n=1 Tax=Acidobacteriaceae TaxID=204434 RepID=UPI001C20B18F|nr:MULTISPECIES: FKBP-type peptidyl-prolyl cis-trans isomerase [Acidobacteriaceae]MDW5264288.1 FKBP-type peptidyl-prolyl cis-trans isomerase [Edaphobacter sp.]
MKPMFFSLALLAAISATAQTTTHKAVVAHHHTATTAVSKIPRVPGIPKSLYTLKYVDIVAGKGPLAETHKWYTVRYTGWLTDGTKFDSSYDHPGGEPFTFPDGAKPQRVIIGWDTGFEGMHVGGKRRLYVPYQLAYGELGRPPVIPAKANLVFDIELVSMSDNPPEEPAPTPAQAPPTQETQPAAPATQPQTSPHPEGL